MINKKVPIYSYSKDNTHCFQEALKMILKYFWPEKDFSWKELDKITGKVEGKWTWPLTGLLWLQEKGFEVISIEIFDNEKFIQTGEAYFTEFYGEKVGKEQIRYGGDIEKIKRDTKEFIKKAIIEKRIPTVDDLKALLSKDYLIICNIRASHSIVVRGFDDKNIFVNNPGSFHGENQPIEFNIFKKLWGYPNDKARHIMAIKLRG